jgi:hypothetical protein
VITINLTQRTIQGKRGIRPSAYRDMHAFRTAVLVQYIRKVRAVRVAQDQELRSIVGRIG